MKKLLVVGAGFLQTFVIKKACELGYYVIAIDGNPNSLGFKYSNEYRTIDITDKDTCLEFAKKNNIDGVITAATDYGVLTVSYIAKNLGLIGLDYSVAEIIKNKYLVRKVLHEKKIDDFEQAYQVTSISDLDNIYSKLKYPVMVKPCDGSGSRGATRVNDIKELKNACIYAMESSNSNIAEIESFIEGTEYGVECFVYQNNIYILGILKKWMTNPPYYAELGHSLPSDLSLDMKNKIKKYVINAIKTLKINHGSVNMDILITKDRKVYIIDVGARMGGNLIGSHIVPCATGIEYIENIIKTSLGELPNFSNEKNLQKDYVSTRILALRPGKICGLPNFSKIEKQYNVKIYHNLREGDYINQYKTNLDGCGYVISIGNSMKATIENAENAMKKIDDGIERI